MRGPQSADCTTTIAPAESWPISHHFSQIFKSKNREKEKKKNFTNQKQTVNNCYFKFKFRKMKIFSNCTMSFPSLLSRMTLNIGLSLHLPGSPFISQKGISWSLNIGELVVSATRVSQQPMLHHPSEHEPVTVHSCFGAPPGLNLNPCGLMSSLRSDAAKSLCCFSDILA